MSVRLRVTLVFTAVMAVVLAGAGLFLYLRLGHELDAGIERNLKARAGVYAAGDTDAIAQGLDPSGRGVRATAEGGGQPPPPPGGWGPPPPRGGASRCSPRRSCAVPGAASSPSTTGAATITSACARSP